MKVLGLIGGTTWVSTIEYYKIINQQINYRLGGLNSAKIFLYSLNFEDVNPSSGKIQNDVIISELANAAKTLQQVGAECILICANTLHRFSDKIGCDINIPIINIIEETAKELLKQKIKKVGLLGTIITMEHSFYKDRISRYGINVLVPLKEDRDFIQASIFNEFGKDIYKSETKIRYLKIIDDLSKKGAEGIILGCTEIPLLIKQEDSSVPLFNTTLIHSYAAVNFVLNDIRKL